MLCEYGKIYVKSHASALEKVRSFQVKLQTKETISLM